MTGKECQERLAKVYVLFRNRPLPREEWVYEDLPCGHRWAKLRDSTPILECLECKRLHDGLSK